MKTIPFYAIQQLTPDSGTRQLGGARKSSSKKATKKSSSKKSSRKKR